MASSSETVNVDDNNRPLPSRHQCQELVEEFAEITGTDVALAQVFLQDKNWDLQVSINAFFETQNSDGRANGLTDGSGSEVVVTFDSGPSSTLCPLGNGTVTTQPPEKFAFMTWNLDGLETHNLKRRTKAVAKILEMEKPDIVFFQEVIPATYSYLEDHLPTYLFIAGGTDDYFIATLLNRTTVYLDGHNLNSFSNTVMNRNLLLVDCHIGSLKLRLMNTHLESTREFSQARKEQLKICLKTLVSGTKDQTSLFGGDLNLRDNEVNEIGLPPGVSDLWEVCGKRPECRYTWDMQRNTNKSFPGKFKPKARFDRIYLYDSQPPSIKALNFGLCGIQKVTETQSFPSDHWGIHIHFRILNQNTKNNILPTDHEGTKSTAGSTSSDSLCTSSIETYLCRDFPDARLGGADDSIIIEEVIRSKKRKNSVIELD